MHDMLKEWEPFYVIVGTSAGALTGLQFVVLTLISESGRVRGSQDTLSAFASPNVVHVCAALLISAILSAPWHGAASAGTAITLCGAGGVLYSISVLSRARRQRDYKPVLEDWIWHAALPIVAYAALAVAGIQAGRASVGALFPIGGAALLLVFIGIHNAWDTVMYVMIDRARQERARSAPASEPSGGTGGAGPPSIATAPAAGADAGGVRGA